MQGPVRGTLSQAMIALLLAAFLHAAPAADPLTIPVARQADVVAVIPIRGPIDAITKTSFERRLDAAIASGADAIAIELDTPGGELLATLEITNLIRTKAPANTVAWVNPFAFSAGTIIALSAREIITAPDAMLGDAAPVTPLGPIPTTERAKVESPLLAEVIDEARRHHYDERLVQAFVSVGIELWLLRNPETGAVVFVDRPEYEAVFGRPPDESLPSISPPANGQPFEVHPFLSLLAGMQPEGVNPEDDIGAEPLLPPTRIPLTAADADRYIPVGQVVSSDRLLTLKPWQAEAYGLSVGTVSNDEALQSFFGARRIFRVEPDWSESLVQVLMSWPVRVAFIAVFVLCVLVEMALPGTGWFGIGAVAALAVLIGTPMLIGLASWWDVAAVLLGLLLIGVELLVVPGTIVAGLTGAALLLVGLVGSAVSGDLTSTEGQESIIRGGGIAITGIGVGLVVGWVIIKRIGGSRIGQGIVLAESVGPHEGAPTEPEVAIGTRALAITDLRPSGSINLHGRTVDAVCSGRWIEAGAAVCVTRAGLVVEVEPCE